MKIHILYLTCLNIVSLIQTLVELPNVEDNNIAITEKVIRNTVNKLFASLKIQDVKHRPRLKQLSSIHSFFVSITLTDSNNLKKIARLVQVVNIDNSTQSFITIINDVLNNGDKNEEANDKSDLYVIEYIETSINRFRKLKETYVSNKTTINANILNYLQKDKTTLNTSTVIDENKNKTNAESDEILSDSEFWRPDGRRIVQGIRTSIKRFPFMASIHFFKQFQCAGSIIQNDLVITSASCLQIAWNNRFFRENPSFLSVQVGSEYYEGSGEIIAVLEIFFHPQYDPRFLSNNLAIMRLTRKISFKNSKRRIKMIDFDRNPTEMPINTPKIILVGWGATDGKNIVYDVFRNKLSYAELDQYPLGDCQDHYTKGFVTQRNFCAGYFSKPGGACNHDAGGPGIVHDLLMGVLSFGSPICGAHDSPTVFTKLGFYTDWIEGIMSQAPPSKYHRTTTMPPKTLYSLHWNPTATKRKITPIGPIPDNYVPKPINEIDTLRTIQDQGFQDFLATIFGEQVNNDKFDAVSKDEIDEDQAVKESKQLPPNLKENNLLKTTPGIKQVQDIDSNKTTKMIARQREPTISLESKKIHKTSETVNNGETTDDEDIMGLIDNLDIDKFLNNLVLEKNNIMKTNKSGKVEINMDASTDSEDDYNNTKSLQRYFSNKLSSNESTDSSDDEVDGLSIPTKNIVNETSKSSFSLFDLVSLVIDEETNDVRQNKRFSL